MEKSSSTKASSFEHDALTESIIGAALEVHRLIGSGLLESAYHECLCYELAERGLAVQQQVILPLVYKRLRIERAYRPDLIVNEAVVVELKTVEKLLLVHEAQVLTYLRLTGLKRGILFNFNSVLLKHGIRRLNLGYPSPSSPFSPESDRSGDVVGRR